MGRASGRAVMLAACSVLVLGAVSVWVARRHSPAPLETRRLDPTQAPDLSNLPDQSAGAPAALSGGREFFVQFTRRDDPNVLAGEVTASRATPLEHHRVSLEYPRAWFFLEDGRSLHVTASRGRLTLAPRTSAPTDGLVEDDVRVLIFAPREGTRRPDLSREQPIATLRTSRVEVDWANGRLELPDELRFQDERVEMHASGLLAQFDPQTSRIDAVRVQRLLEPVRVATRTPPARHATEPPQPATASAPVEAQVIPDRTTRPAADPTIDTPEETFYAIVAMGDVVVRQGARVAKAGELLAWVRTVGGTLALRQPRVPARNSATNAPATHAPAPGSSVVASTPQAELSPERNTPDDGSVTLFWTGPLDIRRDVTRPPQLARDDAMLTLNTDARTPVTLELEGAGVLAGGQKLEVGATREVATLTGSSTVPAYVVADAQGRAESTVFEVDNARALVTMPRGGTLMALDKPSNDPLISGPPAPLTLTWSDEGEFRFDSLSGDGRARLIGARASGQVRAARAGAYATGDTASVDFFDPTEQDERAPIRAVRLLGRVRASDGADGAIRADSLVAHFTRDGPTSSPSRIEAHGHAHASRDGESLGASEIDAVLSSSTQQRSTVAVHSVFARGGFEYSGSEGLVARGDALDADALARTVTMIGNPARVERGASRLNGPRINVDETAGAVSVDGAGTFVHVMAIDTRSPADPNRVREVRAWWSGSMSLDDARGMLTLDGGAELDARSESGATSTARAPRVVAWFAHLKDEPRTVAPTLDDAAGSTKLPFPSRRITHAMLEGDATQPLAMLTHREHVTGTGRATRLLSLQGSRVDADFLKRSVHVDGAGKLVSSQRAEDIAAKAAASGEGSRATPPAQLSGAGDALFTWKQTASLRLDDAAAELAGSVRMVHRRAGDEGVTELECDRLDVTLHAGSSGSDALSLSHADARGSVWARSSGRELSSQSASYNAASGLLEARCEGCQVMLSDPGAGQPLSAGAVRWNLLTGRVDVIDASPLSGAR